MKRRYLLAGLAALAGVAGWSALALSDRAEGAGLLPYRDAAAVAAGETLYREHCASCHGAQLQGEPDWRRQDADGYLPAPPHDRTGHTWHHPDNLLIRITREGSAAVVGGGYRSRMEGFGDILTDTEIRQVLAYIKSTWPPEVIETHDRINRDAGL